MTDVAAVGGAARSCEDLDDAPHHARALAAGITASRKGSLAGDRQSFDSVAMHLKLFPTRTHRRLPIFSSSDEPDSGAL
jgi:hypothetical protein